MVKSFVYMILSIITAFFASTIMASQITAFEFMLSPYRVMTIGWPIIAVIIFTMCVLVFLKLRLKNCIVRPWIIVGFIISVIFVTWVISYLIKIDSKIIHLPRYLSLDAYVKIRGGTFVYWIVILSILCVSDICAKQLANMRKQDKLQEFLPLYYNFISILKKTIVSSLCCVVYTILSIATMRLYNLASTIFINVIIHTAILIWLLITNRFHEKHSKSIVVNIIWLIISLVLFMLINLWIKAIYLYVTF